MCKVSVCSKMTFIGLMLTLSSAGNAQDASDKKSSLDYFPEGDSKFSSHAALQAKACHTLSDPIKIRFVVKDVDTLQDTINIKINGSPVKSSIVPFKDGIDFNLPFSVAASGSVTQSLIIRKPGKEITKPAYQYKDEDLYCFNSALYSGAWENAGNGRTFGLHPISQNMLGAEGHICRENIAHSDPARKFYFNYDEPLDQADPIVQKHLNNGKDDAVAFLADSFNVFYKKRYLVQTPTGDREPSSWQNGGESTVHYDGKNSSDIDNTLDSKFTGPYDGEYSKVNGSVNYSLTQRNINTISLTITEKSGIPHSDITKNVFKWTRANLDDEKTQNVLKLNFEGDADKITSRNLLLGEDMYIKKGFYNSAAATSVFRGTLAPQVNLNSAYDKYTQNHPLSLPALSPGDINLVNTDEIIIMISKDTNSGKYSALFYGQPLQFSGVYSAGKLVGPAASLRNTCF